MWLQGPVQQKERPGTAAQEPGPPPCPAPAFHVARPSSARTTEGRSSGGGRSAPAGAALLSLTHGGERAAPTPAVPGAELCSSVPADKLHRERSPLLREQPTQSEGFTRAPPGPGHIAQDAPAPMDTHPPLRGRPLASLCRGGPGDRGQPAPSRRSAGPRASNAGARSFPPQG